LDGVKTSLKDLDQFKSEKKPEKNAEKLELEALFTSLQMKLRNNNRAPYVPPAGTNPADLQSLWEQLQTAESERYAALRRELERQERLELLNRNFDNRAAKLEQWIKQKQNYLITSEKV
jgi:hypothetical protein